LVILRNLTITKKNACAFWNSYWSWFRNKYR